MKTQKSFREKKENGFSTLSLLCRRFLLPSTLIIPDGFFTSLEPRAMHRQCMGSLVTARINTTDVSQPLFLNVNTVL